MRRHRHLPFDRLAAVAVIVMAVACTPKHPAPPTAPTSVIEREDDSDATEREDARREFQEDILADVDKLDSFIQKTQHGANLTEFTLGWFVLILLDELSSQDSALFEHIHAGGMGAEHYLRHPFQADPRGEIATIEAMAQADHRTLRLATRTALEALTRIPDAKDPPEVQTATRKDLSASLMRLKVLLIRAVAEADSAGTKP